MARLVRVSKSQRIEVELSKDKTVFGREVTCDIVLENDPQISREHCGFRRYEDGAITVTDYGSSNGTFVNGERIFEERRLAHSDKVRLGNHAEFSFIAPELAAPVPPPAPLPDPLPAKKSQRIAPPRSKEEKATAALETELESRSYAAVMRDIVRKTKPKGGTMKSPDPDKPNQYW